MKTFYYVINNTGNADMHDQCKKLLNKNSLKISEKGANLLDVINDGVTITAFMQGYSQVLFIPDDWSIADFNNLQRYSNVLNLFEQKVALHHSMYKTVAKLNFKKDVIVSFNVGILNAMALASYSVFNAPFTVKSGISKFKDEAALLKYVMDSTKVYGVKSVGAIFSGEVFKKNYLNNFKQTAPTNMEGIILSTLSAEFAALGTANVSEEQLTQIQQNILGKFQ